MVGPGSTRREVLSATGMAVTVGLAGCTGGGGGGDTDTTTTTAETTATTATTTTTKQSPPTKTERGGTPGDAGTTATTTQGGTKNLGAPKGSVGKNATGGGLTIVALDSGVDPARNQWGVTVEVKNTGDQSTELGTLYYIWKVTVFTETGKSRTPRIGVSAPDGWKIAPGQTKTLELLPTTELDPDTIARYEVSITCGINRRGVYCGP